MSLPSFLLRLEALTLLLGSLLAYHHLAQPWWLFFAVLLVPDLSMFGYILGSKLGSYTYNAAHTLLVPALLTSIALYTSSSPRTLGLLAVWFAHIGLDRCLGYGLKYPSAFRDTHLQAV